MKLKITSLHSRDALAKYIRSNVPQLQCDYFMTIELPSLLPYDRPILLQSFDIPSSGLSFTSDQVLGHISPTIDFGGSKMHINYYVPNKGHTIIQDLYNNQFSDGVPRFISHSSLPSVHIFKLAAPSQTLAQQVLSTFTDSSVFLEKLHELVTVNPDTEEVMHLYSCRFSRPMLNNVNLGSDEPAVYSCDIYFEDFRVE